MKALFMVLMLLTIAVMLVVVLTIARLFILRRVPFWVVQVVSLVAPTVATFVILGLQSWLLHTPFWG